MQKYTEQDIKDIARKYKVRYHIEVDRIDDITRVYLSNGYKKTSVCVSPATENPFSIEMVCRMMVSAIVELERCTAESRVKVKPTYIGKGR